MILVGLPLSALVGLFLVGCCRQIPLSCIQLQTPPSRPRLAAQGDRRVLQTCCTCSLARTSRSLQTCAPGPPHTQLLPFERGSPWWPGWWCWSEGISVKTFSIFQITPLSALEASLDASVFKRPRMRHFLLWTVKPYRTKGIPSNLNRSCCTIWNSPELEIIGSSWISFPSEYGVSSMSSWR